ncbi:MAG: glutathione S-transferase family protein [Candidatus Lambdaproteobacteria bacterium]|nr:glutathione S-transferase family protein [Candidatus Lambdaproteobacteria bacterium]
MLKLYMGKFSPYARKVRILIAEKELPTEEVRINTNEDPGDYARINPNLRIPALQDGQLTLFESNLILDYLLTTYPDNPLSQPRPPLAPALFRKQQRWADMTVLVTVETMLNSGINVLQMKRSGVEPEQAPYLQKELKRIQHDLDWLEQRATREGFAPGLFSIQDLNLMCALQWFDFRNICTWRGRPNLEAVVKRFAERPSIASTAPKEG